MKKQVSSFSSHAIKVNNEICIQAVNIKYKKGQHGAKSVVQRVELFYLNELRALGLTWYRISKISGIPYMTLHNVVTNTTNKTRAVTFRKLLIAYIKQNAEAANHEVRLKKDAITY